MKDARVKQVLQAAAELPPGKARALVSALCAKDDAKSADDFLAKAEDAMTAAMEMAVIDALETWVKESPEL